MAFPSRPKSDEGREKQKSQKSNYIRVYKRDKKQKMLCKHSRELQTQREKEQRDTSERIRLKYYTYNMYK